MTKRKQQNVINLEDEANRPAFTTLQFWQNCPDRHCRRARSCTGGIEGDPACCSLLEGEERAWVLGYCEAVRAGSAHEGALVNAVHARNDYRARQEMSDLVRGVAAYARSVIEQSIRLRFPRGIASIDRSGGNHAQ